MRVRAHAGVDALDLPGGEALDADTRGRVVDYLLGQQDDGERIVTFAALGESPAACRWAQALRERLAGLAPDELPEVPASAAAATTTNGSAPQAVAVAAPGPAAQPAVPAQAATTTAATLTPPATPAPAGPTPPAAPRKPADPDGSGPSRLGGAILIAGAAALAIVLAIVLIGGGGDDDNGTPSSTSAAQTQTQTRTSTQPTTTPANGQANARVVAQMNLAATPAGGSAIGVGLVQQTAPGRRAIAIQAQRLPANGAQDIYAVWLQGTAGSKFLGFVPRQVRANGGFTVSRRAARRMRRATRPSSSHARA